MKMASMGFFIAYTVVRESWLDKTSFQKSDTERTSPSRRTCFTLPVAWDANILPGLSGTFNLSRQSLDPETEGEKG